MGEADLPVGLLVAGFPRILWEDIGSENCCGIHGVLHWAVEFTLPCPYRCLIQEGSTIP